MGVIFKCIEALNPTKDANAYWFCTNHAMLSFHKAVSKFWRIEKVVTLEALSFAKEEALVHLAQEREKIMKMSREDAISQLIKHKNIVGREKVIRSVSDNGILSIA